MIVFSVGLQKSGSGLFFNLTNDLLIAAGKEDVRDIKSKFNLEDILKYYNCNIVDLSDNNLNYLLSIHDTGNTFVVKTHNGPTKFLEMLMNKGIVKVTCIYRDPRDVVLSAMDHGRKIISKGETHTFASCSSIETTIPIVKSWLDNNIMKWIELDSSNLMIVKYEDLIAGPMDELKKLAGFLDIKLNNIDLETIYSRYASDQLDEFQKNYLHFHVGEAGRFRSALQGKDLKICNHHLSKYLEKMGYDV